MMRIQKGFTLIELMLSTTLIGILSSIALPKLSGIAYKAKVVEVKVASKTFYSFLDTYFLMYGETPDDALAIGIDVPKSSYFHYTLGTDDDFMGETSKSNNWNSGNNKKDHKTTICHGASGKGVTITVANQAVENAHKKHGDQTGACTDEQWGLVLEIIPKGNYHPDCNSTSIVQAHWTKSSQEYIDMEGQCSTLL